MRILWHYGSNDENEAALIKKAFADKGAKVGCCFNEQ